MVQLNSDLYYRVKESFLGFRCPTLYRCMELVYVYMIVCLLLYSDDDMELVQKGSSIFHLSMMPNNFAYLIQQSHFWCKSFSGHNFFTLSQSES